MRNPADLSWALVALYVIHLLEEYFAGVTLRVWLSDTFNADLSSAEFLIINGGFLGIVVGNAILFATKRGWPILLIAIITVFTLNGALHGLARLYWWEYVPGTISGLLLYVPLGIFAFRAITPSIPGGALRKGVLLGILIHALVFALAITI